MSEYKKILFATDFAEDSYQIGLKAKQISSKFNAELHLIHVIASMPEYSIGYMMSPEVEQRMLGEAKQALLDLGEALRVPLDRQCVCMGSPKNLVLGHAENILADLIIVGSHGHHGWALLLGSTAAAIMNSADCDIMVLKSKNLD